MSDRPVINLDILDRTSRTADEIFLLKLCIVIPLAAAGAIMAITCVPQGLANIRNVQIAEMEP